MVKTSAPLEVRKKRSGLVNPRGVCDECLHVIRLRVYRDEEVYFIAIGCKCQPRERLSENYDTLIEAQLDLSSLSWKD